MAQTFTQQPVFEITDYTTASNWERFIALIEETVTSWELTDKNKGEPRNLNKGEISLGIWHEKYELLVYGESSFDLRYLFLKTDEETSELDSSDESYSTADSEKSEIIDNEANCLPACLRDIISTENDFSPKAHCLVRFYGLRHLIILTPKGDTIISENRVKLILSSASIALSNIGCHVPFFVQTHNPRCNFYQGISEHANIRTMYEMVLIKQNLEQYSYFQELLDLFREKINSSISDIVYGANRFTYSIKNFSIFKLPETEDEVSEHQENMAILVDSEDKETSVSKQTIIGKESSLAEVINELKTCPPPNSKLLHSFQVGATWGSRSDKIIVDNQAHTELTPDLASIWTLRVVSSINGRFVYSQRTFLIYKIFVEAINYLYDELDGEKLFKDETKDSLKLKCLELSFDLAKEPEVEIPRSSDDCMRKIIATIFHMSKLDLYNESGVSALEQLTKNIQVLNADNILKIFATKSDPSIKEYILRTEIPKPSVTSPNLPQRMFCTITKNEFRLCGAFSELCN